MSTHTGSLAAMNRRKRNLIGVFGVGTFFFATFLCVPALADEPAAASNPRAAVERALPLIRASAEKYTHERDCFSCHHQALPAMAVAAARERGWLGEGEGTPRQSEFTRNYFHGLREELPGGKGVVGGAYTAGYALLGLSSDRQEPGEVSQALVEYLLAVQGDDGRWRIQTHRPPLEDSDFTATALAVHALARESREPLRDRTSAAAKRGLAWLAGAKPESLEDHAMRLLGLSWGEADAMNIQEAAAALWNLQREDGGFAQTVELSSDAYATGMALTALAQADRDAPRDARYRLGVAWLLKAQLADGSWHVKSRSDPFQTYFESDFPHGADQFISIAASSWAVMALSHYPDSRFPDSRLPDSH